jgi:hypothetical protein
MEAAAPVLNKVELRSSWARAQLTRIAAESEFAWYAQNMRMKTKPWDRHTTIVPITTMEEVPVLTPEERAALIASLEEADARIEAGEFVEHDAATFEDRLLSIHRKAKSAGRT